MKYLLIMIIFFGCAKEPEKNLLIGNWEMKEIHSYDPFSQQELIFKDCGNLIFEEDSGAWIITKQGFETNDNFIWANNDSLIHFQYPSGNIDYKILYQTTDSLIINEIIGHPMNHWGISFSQDKGLKLFLAREY